jgi:hypothetical protein
MSRRFPSVIGKPVRRARLAAGWRTFVGDCAASCGSDSMKGANGGLWATAKDRVPGMRCTVDNG